MTQQYERASGVDGLVILGTPRIGYHLVHEATGWNIGPPRSMRIEYGRIEHGPECNWFRTVREAKAAAAGIADLVDWSDPDLAEHAKTWTSEHRMNIFRAMAKAMTEATEEGCER